jgi:hypothetical protein
MRTRAPSRRGLCVQSFESGTDTEDVLGIVLIVGGFVLGLAVGRWWILAAAVAFGLWAGSVEAVEVSAWVIAIGYGGFAAIGLASGVLFRRLLFSPRARV